MDKKNIKKNSTKKNNENKNSKKNNFTEKNGELKLEIICVAVICISLLLVISVFFGGGGFLGKIINKFLIGLMGIGAYALPLILVSFSIYMLFKEDKRINLFKVILSIIIFTILMALMHIINKDTDEVYANYGSYLINEYKNAKMFDGGIIGAIFGDVILKIVGKVASYIILIISLTCSIILISEKSFLQFIKNNFNKITKYFYYEYNIKENDEYNEYNEYDEYVKEEEIKKVRKKNKPKILEIFKKEINNYEDESEYLEDNYRKRATTIAMKYENSIYDGKDKYIKLEKPVFLNLSEDQEKNTEEKIVLATEIINKERKEKVKNFDPTKKRSEVPEFLNINKNNKIVKNDNLFNINYKNTENTEKEILKQNLYKENLQEIKENIPQKPQEIKKLKREDFANLTQTVYTIDFDIPTRKEIEELFSNPPENELSDDINFDNINKLDDYFDFGIDDIKNDNVINYENNFIYPFKEENILENIEKNTENSTTNIKETILQNYTESPSQENIYQNNEKNNINENFQQKNEPNPPTTYIDTANTSESLQKNEPIIIKAEKQKILNEQLIKELEEYKFPKLSFLNKNTNDLENENDTELKENSEILVKTLKSFNVNAQVINISRGPSVTRYELSIEDGIKVSKILGLSDNLALSLAANSIRIEAPIPGKSAVGIEIPNKEVKSVFLSEVIASEKFQKFPSKVSFGLGKDITGNVIVTDIAKMPHMLIAGATGSGKSVCINTLITSILYKACPKEVKLMMIDPKVVELSVYNGIPHLLTPVVTEPEKASGVLKWAVSEMMERYNLFAQTGTRNLIGYNQLKEENGEEKLPQIVIIIDELADLMIVAAKEVEASICRLAQLARAAGIHLIIATQRPSVDVITGLIKANIPSRIAFAVSSGTDSRTVIDSVGAEKLLGKGDMLFKSVDMSKALRIQGAFISDKEVEKIVTFIKENNQTCYDETIINKIETSTKSNNDDASGETDEITDEVIGFLVRKGKASTSMIQRQFRIGYNRAARIIEELEDRGIVSSENGSKQRDVLMDKYQYEEYMNRY